MKKERDLLRDIKELQKKIIACKDDKQAVELQTKLLELIENTLKDKKFKEAIIKNKN